MRYRRLWPIALIVVGAVMLAVGVIVLQRPAPAPHTATRPVVAAAPKTVITDFPSPSPLVDVPPDGERIRVPELGIDLPVVAGDGYNAPLYKAVIYPGLKLPGQGGRSVIYAHARAGMFGPLFNAHTGQEIDVAEPTGKVRRYRITEYHARWPISDVRWLQPADHEQLVLITCTTYNYNDPRIVAVAEPI